jgi:hypothetical protein
MVATYKKRLMMLIELSGNMALLTVNVRNFSPEVGLLLTARLLFRVVFKKTGEDFANELSVTGHNN